MPNSGVFDEQRIFTPGNLSGPVNIKGVRIGIPICEDIWKENVIECLAESGAEIIISINASPFTLSKNNERLSVAISRIRENDLPLVYLNRYGGQDELVFDGNSKYLSVAYQNFVALLVEAVKEQNNTITDLKDRISKLENPNK